MAGSDNADGWSAARGVTVTAKRLPGGHLARVRGWGAQKPSDVLTRWLDRMGLGAYIASNAIKMSLPWLP